MMNNRIEVINKHLFTGIGEIKLDLTDIEKERWYNHLLEESIVPRNNKISKIVELQIVAGIDSGLTELEITRTVPVSRTTVRNYIINKKYNNLLERVNICAIQLGDRKRNQWGLGGKICL